MAASGYECEFVESVQEFECPLCLHVTREPHQTDCCGHDFCQSCINCILTDNNPYPFCRTRPFTAFNDRNQRRRVIELKVYCTMKDKGCSWIGELGELDSHLDTKCQYIHINCTLCRKTLQRRFMCNHLLSVCPKRAFTCQYCGFMATFEDVYNKHMPVCTKYPLPCPNYCGIGTVERGYMGLHLRECPLQLVQCKFSHVGCSEQIRRKDIQGHMESNMHIHLVMTSTTLSQKEDEMPRKLAEKDTEMRRKLAEKDKQLQRTLTENHIEMQRELAEKDTEMQRMLAEKDKEMRRKLAEKDTELQRKLTEKYIEMQRELIKRHKEMQRELAEKDKEMQRKLAQKDAGVQRKLAEKDTEMQRHIAEKDEEMHMHDVMAFTILGQKEDEMQRKLAEKDKEMQRKLAEKDAGVQRKLAEKDAGVQRKLAQKDAGVQRKLAQKDAGVQRKLAEKDAGVQRKLAEKDTEMQRQIDEKDEEMHIHDVMAFTTLSQKEDELQRKLAEKDTEMRIKLAQKDKEIEHQAKLLNPELPPFTVHNYTRYEGKNKRWDQCPCFYTHYMGAKIRISLFMLRQRLNQVDIELWQEPGEFDEAIDWPVRCTVTVQILNQIEDKNHLRFSRDYELNRIQYTPRSCGDIAHRIPCSTLRPPQHDIQYVKNDCLRIRAKVVLK